MPARKDTVSKLERSPKKPKARTSKKRDSAAGEFGEGKRVLRTAVKAVKHTLEKAVDPGEPKRKKEPGLVKAADGRSRKKSSLAKAVDGRRGKGKTTGKAKTSASKHDLMDRAKKLDISGRSRMTKTELVDAIRKADAKSTRRAREK